MATGMVSSAHTLSTATAAPTSLRSGEKVATSPQALKAAGAKTYRHMVPGARFVMPDGLEVQFLGGQFTTTDKEIIAELDKIANRNTSMIFTDPENAKAALATVQRAADDAADTAGKTAA